MKPGNVVVLLVDSIGPVPSQLMSTATVRSSRVVIVPEIETLEDTNTSTGAGG